MEKNNITRMIDELTKSSKEYTRNLNEGLNKIRGEINKTTADADPQAMYELGFEDGYMLAMKVFVKIEGCYAWDELCEIFDRNLVSIRKIHELPPKEVREKVAAYEQKKKEEEENKHKATKVGDMVEVWSKIGNNPEKVCEGIYTGCNDTIYYILTNGFAYTRAFPIKDYYMAKTGKHFDIQGMFDEMKGE